MPTVKIRDELVAVDVRGELEVYDWGPRAKWSHDKLIAPSPFRDDHMPSFFVRLEQSGDYPAGIWSDSGAYDDRYAKGGLAKLLAFLRAETIEETERYLLDKYAKRGDKRVLIVPHITKIKTRTSLPSGLVTPAVSGYLSSRGISEEAQINAGTGRGPYKGYVALPWRLSDGRLVNVKYRATKGKLFFYEDNAWPIGELVWGIDSVGSGGVLVICEAEIDALSWRTAGFAAVATGHGALSAEQADLLLRLGFDSFIAGGDNDLVGNRFNEQLKRVLGKSVSVGTLNWDGVVEKDANEILQKRGIDGLRQLADTVKFPSFFKKIQRG